MKRGIAVSVALAAAAVLVAVAALAGPIVAGDAPEPGSEADPLVSKSYFDRYVALEIVNLPAGTVLSCHAGTEVILRAGRATAVGGAQGGLADVTAGKDVQTGQPVSPNHLLIVPRSDGRGIRAVTDCVVMIRGPHSTAP